MDQEERPSEDESKTTDESVSPLDLLFLTRAYNRNEITFAEWLKLTKQWAEAIIQQYGEGQ